jgi:hypothetical protein
LAHYGCANRSLTDAVLTVDAILVSGDAVQTGPLVIWRYVDDNNFYSLWLTGDGNLLISKRFKGEYQTLYD